MNRQRTLLKRLAHWLEASLVFLILGLFRLLPLTMASTIGGFIARKLGKFFKWHKIAQYNLNLAYGETRTEVEKAQILIDMWDNLGRSLAEIPHLGGADLPNYLHISKATHQLSQSMLKEGKPLIFLGGHFANWEMIPYAGSRLELPLTSIYRKLNNPILEGWLYRIRSRYCFKLEPKGKKGAKAILNAMRHKQSVGVLIDQKMNEGLQVPFFGTDAPTVTTPLEIGIRSDANFIFTRVIRTHGCNFELELKPFDFDYTAPLDQIALQMNQQLESWINEYPAQWMWMHQRWHKVKFKD